ncbi:amidohydrolase family protein [Natronoarchaeum rubrum]|uniref:amidohydrolase family protein n=1 Tax=Natronoarchaeum rubrum TaxID=755311 RepID=UPI0021115842|nr:amidohydrolase family protein [Natronoarchaeum rubrum]
MELEGIVLRGRSFDPVEGRVVIEDGEIVAVEETSTDSDDVILPAFVNAHTHLGDSIAKEAGGGLTLEELVAPPDGLKHRLLDAADRDELVAGMRRSLRFMRATGTGTCIEFREGGVEGVEQLQDAADGLDVEPVILGRETTDAMEASDGFGASGANDADFDRERRATREAGKLFGIHAGEVDSSDVDPALDLDPDFLVHMVHPEPHQLDRIADSEVPIVLCPRSNVVTDVGLPPAEELAERTTLALGTDNVMTNSPSMFREMAFAAKLFDLPAREVLRMATINGAEIAGLDRGVVAEGREAKLQVLDGDSHNLAGAQDIVRAVVRRAGEGDVNRIVL